MSLRGFLVVASQDASSRDRAVELAEAFFTRWGRGAPEPLCLADVVAVCCDLRSNRNHDEGPSHANVGRWQILAFDGWLENAHTLIDELGLPATAADAVIVAACIDRWGWTALDRLFGEYAFVVWNHQAKSGYAVRDKGGVRPLYCAEWREGVAISNLPGLLARLPQVGEAIDWVAAAEYLCDAETRAEATLFAHVRRIVGGHALAFSAAAAGPRVPYWRPATGVVRCRPDAAAEEVRRLLADAVSGAARGAAFVGAHLSGGIDSSVVCIQLDRLVRAGRWTADRAAALSMVYPGEACDETPWIDAVATRIGLPHHCFGVRFATLAELRRSTLAQNYPIAPQHGTAEAALLEFASSRGGVVLTGEGGDELFEPTDRALRDALLAPRDWAALGRWLAQRWSERLAAASMLGKIRHVVEPCLPRRWSARIHGWRDPASDRFAGLDPRWRASIPAEVLRGPIDFPRGARTLSMGSTLSLDWSLSWEFYHRLALHAGTELRHPLSSVSLMTFCNQLPLALLDGQEPRNRVLLRAAALPELPSEVANRVGKAEFSQPTLPILRQRLAEQIGSAPGTCLDLAGAYRVRLPAQGERSIWPYESLLSFHLWWSMRAPHA